MIYDSCDHLFLFRGYHMYCNIHQVWHFLAEWFSISQWKHKQFDVCQESRGKHRSSGHSLWFIMVHKQFNHTILCEYQVKRHRRAPYQYIRNRLPQLVSEMKWTYTPFEWCPLAEVHDALHTYKCNLYIEVDQVWYILYRGVILIGKTTPFFGQ